MTKNEKLIEDLKVFIETYENMTPEERAAQKRVEVEVDFTDEERIKINEIIEQTELTVDEFFEMAIIEHFRSIIKGEQ